MESFKQDQHVFLDPGPPCCLKVYFELPTFFEKCYKIIHVNATLNFTSLSLIQVSYDLSTYVKLSKLNFDLESVTKKYYR